MRRPSRKQPPLKEDHRRAFPQVNSGAVGLAGLEPAASSLSEMDGRAPCYPAFALVVPLRRTYKDGVNLSVQIRPSVLACPRRVVSQLNCQFSETDNEIGQLPWPLECQGELR